LSVLLQAYYKIEYLFTVNPQVFNPPPHVKSAVIRLTRNNIEKLDCDEELFFKVVKAGFNQRRKTLRNSLGSMFNVKDLQSEFLTKRAEQLSVKDFVELTKAVKLANC
jgi:16S rRNA (adenine1518-N6/adenine1519-N6)-dimethyltransferase